MNSKRIAGLLAGFCLLATTMGYTQSRNPNRPYTELSWKHVATRMPQAWYAGAEAKAVAENVLVCQRWSGGWPKNKPMHLPLSPADCSGLIEDKRSIHDATFDNDATTTELKFLAKVYNATKEERYKEAFENGLIFIFQAQYPNGGWPQVWPLRPGYYSHITINDDAMINNMELLREIAGGDPEYAFLDRFFVERSRKVLERGIACLLQMQIVKDGVRTVWCSQHDEYDFQPAMGRIFERPSFSGSESVPVVRFLMDEENPSPEVIDAVKSAVRWFESHAIRGIRVEATTTPDGQRDRIVVEDPNAPLIWARFYDLETEKPFFCGRDGVKRATMADIERERRAGYGWYTTAPQELLDVYPEWEKKITNK